MIEAETLLGELVENQPLIGDISKTIEIIGASGNIDITENGNYDVTQYATANVDVPQPSGGIDITNNGTYDVTNYVSANVNIPLGLEYETGTYTPTEETTRPTISFSRTHTETPVYVMIIDGSSERTTSGGLGFWHYIDYEKWFSATIKMSTNPATPPAYVATYMFYMPSSSYTERSNELRYPSSDTTDTNTGYPRYYVTPTNFKPGVVTTTQAKFVANRTYKWVAIWK